MDAAQSISPYMRTGLYSQELAAHRTVGSAVSLTVGPLSSEGMFSLLASLGDGSIPAAQYIDSTTKVGIPFTVETSRMEWSDQWNRNWAEPAQTVYIVVAPFPGPLRNFQMSTTFELLNPTTGERYLEWPAAESVIIRTQVKVLNPYPLSFYMGDCQENQILTLQNGSTVTNMQDSNQFFSYSYDDGYGVCLQYGNVIINNVSLTAADRTALLNSNCATQYPLGACSSNAVLAPGAVSSVNYIPQVEQHYPAGYIPEVFWQEGIYNSANGADDDWLPNVDNGMKMPQNIVLFPIFKGLGYEIAYSKDLKYPRPLYSQYSGWWSDQLQNKDGSLYAGNSKSNNISVGAQPLIDQWVNIKQLEGANPAYIESRLGNMYICLFNQYRAALDPMNPVGALMYNVVLNNVVPIDHTLNTTDPRLTAFNCTTSFGYDQINISSFTNNYVSTESQADYLYFGVSLRANSLEDINVLSTLTPITQFEGPTEVSFGGQFTYWNPGLGNYETVADGVSAALGVRTDLNVMSQVWPAVVPQLNATTIQVIQLADPDEIQRTWTNEIWTNSYGFGDAEVWIYVGGPNNTMATANPGESIIVQIEFVNNAGFDWVLKANAITFNYSEAAPMNFEDALDNYQHTIRDPIEYKFMTVNIPDQLKPYITVKPSHLFDTTAPLTFDFSSNNAASVLDGYWADYYYEITLSDTIPDSVRGKVISLSVTLNTEYFMQLPGPNDPTGIHDYTLSIPPILFGIPYSSESAWAGNVFWTIGHAHNTTLIQNINPSFEIMGAYVATQGDYLKLQNISLTPENRTENIQKFWRNLTETSQSVPYTVSTSGTDSILTFNMEELLNSTLFPRPEAQGPDLASLFIFVGTFSPELSLGLIETSYLTQTSWVDDFNITRVTTAGSTIVSAQGPEIAVTYWGAVFTPQGIAVLNNTLTYNQSGIAKANVTLDNQGSFFAFNVLLYLTLPPNITFINATVPGCSVTPNGNGWSTLTVPTGMDLAPAQTATLLLSFNVAAGAQVLNKKRQTNALPAQQQVIISTALTMFQAPPNSEPLSSTPGSFLSVSIDSAFLNIATLKGQLNNQQTAQLQTFYTPTILTDIRYSWWRLNTGAQSSAWECIAVTSTPTLSTSIIGFDSVEFQTSVIWNDTITDELYSVALTNTVSFSTATGGSAFPVWIAIVIGLALFCCCLTAIGLAVLALLALRDRDHEEVFLPYDTQDPTDMAPLSTSAHYPLTSNETYPEAYAESAKPKSFMDRVSRYTSSVFGYNQPTETLMENQASDQPGKRNGRWVVDMDYLFVGAKRVVVKDGNPTSPKPPPNWNPDDEGGEDHDHDNDNDNEHEGNELDDLAKLNGQGGDVEAWRDNIASRPTSAAGGGSPMVVVRRVGFWERFWRRIKRAFSLG